MGIQLSINTIIKLALYLIVASILIYLAVSGIFDQGKSFIGWISQAERCEGRTVGEYESMLKGYNAQGEIIEVYQLCQRYKRCFRIEFNEFEKKNPNICKVIQ